MPYALLTLLAFAFNLAVIILVHEAGHLLVAKAFRVRVLTFSIGFGKRIWGFRRGDTDYRLSAVPLGGYVRMSGEHPGEETGDPDDFLSKPRWQRILVYLAGPTMNVLLSIAVVAGLFMAGGVAAQYLSQMAPLVGGTEEGSSAAAAGIRQGDRIVAVDGKPAKVWQDVLMAMLASRPVALTLERDGHALTATVTPKKDPRYEIGDLAGLLPSVRPRIIRVLPGSPAEAAGFQPGDEILDVGGQAIFDARQFIDVLARYPGQRVDIRVARDGREQPLSVVPRSEGKAVRIGTEIGIERRYGLGQALVKSVQYNLSVVESTVEFLGKVVRGEVSAKGAVGGPIEIAHQSGEAARLGFRELLHLLALISLSIAMLNLMPIPILDGGNIFILLVEGVMRRDLSLRLKEVVAQVGIAMILLLMVVVFSLDLMRNVPAWIHGSDKAGETAKGR
jgi:regulator of sigma E protease